MVYRRLVYIIHKNVVHATRVNSSETWWPTAQRYVIERSTGKMMEEKKVIESNSKVYFALVQFAWNLQNFSASEVFF